MFENTNQSQNFSKKQTSTSWPGHELQLRYNFVSQSKILWFANWILKLFINNSLSICERDQLFYYVYRSILFLWTSFWEHSNKINIYLYRIIVGFCTQQTKGAISGTVPGLYELYVWISTYRYKLCGSITCNFVLYNLYFTSHHK